jgi:hypothetical protein
LQAFGRLLDRRQDASPVNLEEYHWANLAKRYAVVIGSCAAGVSKDCGG